jgi:hypothetical protein
MLREEEMFLSTLSINVYDAKSPLEKKHLGL